MKLLLTRFKSDWFNFKEMLFTWKRFYSRSLLFAKADLYLLSLYLFKSPFRIVKREAPGEIYGETPLRAMEKIAKEMKLSPEDTLFEVGAGRGRALLFATLFFGCRSVAVEKIASFIKRLQLVIKRFSLTQIEIEGRDFLEVDYSTATAIYFYGITFSDEMVDALAAKWKRLPSETRIVTISQPLATFHVVKQFKLQFPWGETEAFLQTPI